MNILSDVGLPKQYHITIVLKPVYYSRFQHILVQSEAHDEEATAPAGWILRFDRRDNFGYAAMFTRAASPLSSDTVTISLAYSDRLATVMEVTGE